MKITQFEDIGAWKAARILVRMAYDVSETKGLKADLELRRQMVSCASSSMSNIAEGFDSGSDREFARFLRIAQRSATEFQSHLYIASDRGYIRREEFERLYSAARDVKRLAGGFIRHLTKPGTRNKAALNRGPARDSGLRTDQGQRTSD